MDFEVDFKVDWSSNFRVTPCKGTQDDLGFWIPRCGFPDSSTAFPIFLKIGTWISDSNCWWDSGFIELDSDSKDQDSVLHKQICSGFRILQAKLSILTFE